MCDTIVLDLTFQVSLIGDLVSGMHYLHDSVINVHGRLKSKNCVVDSRFALKIADFGLPSLRNSAKIDLRHPVDAKGALWTAPELLRDLFAEVEQGGGKGNYKGGTQKGDIYSFGIILHEILVRQGTFHLENEDWRKPVDILRKVANRKMSEEPFRPSLPAVPPLENDLKLILQLCWDEDEQQRPEFSVLKGMLKKFRREKFGANDGNLHDKLVNRLEQYAVNLEDLVKERTQNYLDQRNRADNLLYQIMPK